MIRGAAGIDVMRADLQHRAMVQQAVEHVRRFVAGRRHDAHAVGAVLIGDMRVETQTRVLTVARVYVAGGIPALGGAEELPVGRRGGAVAPDGCNRQPWCASMILASAAA